MNQFFREKYTWQAVYYHFQIWGKNGSWEKIWNNVFKKHKHLLDMSGIQLDGTHTPAKRGGESVAYQGRKKSQATPYLYYKDGNITYIGSGMGNLVDDNFLFVQVNNEGIAGFDLIALQGGRHRFGKLEDYILP